MVEDIVSRSAGARRVGLGPATVARGTGVARPGSTTGGRVRTLDPVGSSARVCLHRAGGTRSPASEAATSPAPPTYLTDGSGFAVSDARDVGGATSRTVGLLVADLDAGVADLRAAGVGVDDPQQNDRYRYAQFVAPDGELYELVEERAAR